MVWSVRGTEDRGALRPLCVSQLGWTSWEASQMCSQLRPWAKPLGRGWNPDGSGSKRLDSVCSMVPSIERKSDTETSARKESTVQSELAAVEARRQGFSEEKGVALVLPVPKPPSTEEVDAHGSKSTPCANVVKWTSDEPSVLGSTRLKTESEEGSLVQMDFFVDGLKRGNRIGTGSLSYRHSSRSWLKWD